MKGTIINPQLIIIGVVLLVVFYMFSSPAQLFGSSFCSRVQEVEYDRQIRITQTGGCSPTDLCSNSNFPAILVTGVPDDVIKNFVDNGMKPSSLSTWQISCSGSNCGQVGGSGTDFVTNAEDVNKHITILAAGDLKSGIGQAGDGSVCTVNYNIVFDDTTNEAVADSPTDVTPGNNIIVDPPTDVTPDPVVKKENIFQKFINNIFRFFGAIFKYNRV